MSGRGTGGMSTIESLIAIVVFTLGVLGAAGTTALSVRLDALGQRSAAAARFAVSSLDSIRGAVRNAGAQCAAARAGWASGPSLSRADWSILPAIRGVEVQLRIEHRTVVGLRTDTVMGFVPCR